MRVLMRHIIAAIARDLAMWPFIRPINPQFHWFEEGAADRCLSFIFSSALADGNSFSLLYNQRIRSMPSFILNINSAIKSST